MIRWFFDLILIGLTSAALAQTPNYDETKVDNYVLPDPLVDGKGKYITTQTQWLKTRRLEILDLFKANVYGNLPGATKGIHFKVTAVDKNALYGKATRKEITVFFTEAHDGPSMDVLLYLPNHVNKAVPVFIGLNYFGNHSIHTDPNIKLSDQWMRESESYKIVNHKATAGSRGVHAHRWPVEMLLANGYGVATAYYGDLEPDHEEGWKDGIRNNLQQELKIQPTEWGAIGAAITKNFPYWFHSTYATYGQRVADLPVDQHMLLALMAPRPLYIASAEDDQWADPKGEYLSLVNAGPVYTLFGSTRLLNENLPVLNTPIFGDVGYHIRDGKHDITLKDWTHFVTFSEMHIKRKRN